MNILEAAILGLVQGLTEFLPVSSSGHLAIAENLFGLKGDSNLFFIVMLHLASLAAIVVYYWHNFLKLFTTNRYEIGYIVVGSIPAAIIGLLFKRQIEATFEDVVLVSLFLCVTGIFLFIADRLSRERVELREAGILRIIIIGIAQAVAILPGISRSGSTIGSGFLTGIKRTDAVRFSFFLGAPAIFGAGILTLKDAIDHKVTVDFLPILIGMGIAFFVSLLSIRLVELVAQKNKFRIFAFYCLVVGLTAFVYFMLI
ncbi:MAG: hypothetical protein A2W23_02155 [Planctomycetes bacterium RBG_16_43_13]|nr:MAG: hypothetical protein A2W23_02155 [Planctomycetes bacterium RBG_16_43_13]